MQTEAGSGGAGGFSGENPGAGGGCFSESYHKYSSVSDPFDSALSLQKLKNGRNLITVFFHYRLDSLGNDTGRVTNTELTAVISNNAGAKALKRAEEHGIPGICISSYQVSRLSLVISKTLRIKENPLECTPEDAMPTKISPALMFSPIKLAFLLDKHDTVGIDCVAMCVNDVACVGGEKGHSDHRQHG